MVSFSATSSPYKQLGCPNPPVVLSPTWSVILFICLATRDSPFHLVGRHFPLRNASAVSLSAWTFLCSPRPCLLFLRPCFLSSREQLFTSLAEHCSCGSIFTANVLSEIHESHCQASWGKRKRRGRLDRSKPCVNFHTYQTLKTTQVVPVSARSRLASRHSLVI
jgi:hypothetical protein